MDVERIALADNYNGNGTIFKDVLKVSFIFLNGDTDV
jgi:hypothetical protein